MSIDQKILRAVSLCRKAGRLVCGFDASAKAMNTGEAELLIILGDLSPGSTERIRFRAEATDTDFIILEETDVYDVARVLPKPSGIIAITDKNLAAMVRKTIEDNN